MSTIDLKGLVNTFRIPKLVYTKNSSKREIEEERGLDIGSEFETLLSPTISLMAENYSDVSS